MRDGITGLAVWPSGQSWVLLQTADGWEHVSNATPIAVPTGGGLVVDAADGMIAAAVGAHNRLVRSPLLTQTVAKPAWAPAELPGAVVNARGAVAVSAAGTSVVLDAGGGTVVQSGSGGWIPVTSAAKLAPGSDLRLDDIVWASDTIGWITGHAAAGTSVAFQTTDGGRTWAPLSQLPPTVAALAPCGQGQNWVLAIVTTVGTLTVERTTNTGKTWTAGAALPLPSGSPVWGCRASEVWVEARAGHKDDVFSSADGGASWSDRGAAPRGLTDLTPVGNGAGFAASRPSKNGKPATEAILWDVTGSGARFTARPLPGWVATLGAQMSTS
jgi:hypothetical protein